MDKDKLSAVISIVVSALIALAAVFGYNVIVVQPALQSLTTAVVASANAPAVGSRAVNTDQYVESLWVDKELTVGGTISTTATIQGPSLVFEGATADAYETTFAITDPASSDKTITFPNSSGTVALNPAAGTWEFEGTTANEFETTLSVVDPTADNTVSVPNASGTVMLSSLATNAPDAANSVTGASNALVFEGSGVDAFETSLSAANPGADATLTLPAETAAVMVSSLTTNATDAANSVTGASNALVYEGSAADAYETSVVATNATADRTVTLQDATGTVALTSQGVDMTLTADSTGGNAGAKTEFIGLPRIKLVGLGTGTNPGSQTISLFDDTPDGEWAPVDADVTESADTAIYRYGSKSYKAAFAVTAAAGDGIVGANVGAGAAWDDMESVGLWVYSTATWASGDLTLVLTDDGGARTFDIPALTVANQWTWLEVNIATGDLSAVSDVAIKLSAAGETALGAFDLYIDQAWVWDSADEGALGVAIQLDGVLSVMSVVTGEGQPNTQSILAEGTNYIVHYESGVDFIVWIDDQSANSAVALVAY